MREQWSGSGTAQCAGLCFMQCWPRNQQQCGGCKQLSSAWPWLRCAMSCCAVQEAGFEESTQLLVEDVMMGKNVPDPRDIRKYDLIGVFGMVNYRTLRVSGGRGPLALSLVHIGLESCTRWRCAVGRGACVFTAVFLQG